MINVGVLLQFLEMRLGFNSYIVVVRTTLHAYSCWSGMEANNCGFWVLQNIVCDFGLFQHWTGFENSFSPCLLYIFIATERAFYCEEIIICWVELQTVRVMILCCLGS